MKRVLIFAGTRPEAIKLAPLVFALRASGHEAALCSTGQHGEMLQGALRWFGLQPAHDLNIMQPRQQTGDVVAAALAGANAITRQTRPDWVVVQGDTATATAGALAGFYADVPVAHVEAGLRSGNRRAPWPEEVNRQIISRAALAHFAVTDGNAEFLRQEGVDGEVTVTGNTVLDALLWTRDKLREGTAAARAAAADVTRAGYAAQAERPFALITGHRRESFGAGMQNICAAIKQLARRNGTMDFVYAVHLNPAVQDTARAMLGGERNVFLLPPLDYAAFVYLMSRCRFILSDSGGIQEEAPTLDKPLLIMREVTERPEVVDCGAAALVGVRSEGIAAAATRLLQDDAVYARMAAAKNPFGDGQAAQKIVARLAKGGA